ncbi:hypothetical protein WR25_01492 [Diploscapter pachys]|uniref:Uncharacterized protein n=1 Tax=Diploscapter pachys TaxID=2018661 RepID=A0A2A2JR57_9BILA|nr:hypothetical protein WR25_05617 [Diploscapter pachys]PAV64155.1 hypothetical protein WR25_01492 [Diploscapter pachys]
MKKMERELEFEYCVSYNQNQQVNRREIINAFKREPELNTRLQTAFGHNLLYFSRTYGLFQICFPDTVPSDIGSFSKFGSPCIENQDYFPPSTKQENYTTAELQRLYLLRASVILYCLGILFVLICLIIGVFGCWKRSPKLILATSLMLLFAVLFLASGMALWHYVNYMERYVLETDPFYKSWEPILKLVTRFNFGWSYVVSWIGITFLLLATIFMLISYKAIKNEEDMALTAKHGPYIMPNYYDKGAMVPYGYNTMYSTGYNYPYTPHYGTGYYGSYMTYGR